MSVSGSPKLYGGEHVLNILEASTSSSRVVALVRHAERFKPAPVHRENRETSGLLLTPEGHVAAKQFGRSLPLGRSLRIFHSSSQRAVETAEDILAGFLERGVSPPSSLGGVEPLLSTFHGSTADEVTQNRLKRELGGGKALMRAWMDGAVSPSVLRPASEARARLLEMMRTRLLSAPKDSLELLISHDFAVILLRDWLFGVKFEEAAWPVYLDGIVIFEREEGGLTAAWRDRTFAVPPEVTHA